MQITDFGLALALRGKFGGATSQSGTPQFASPEQLLGERVDQRSDLYSLAAVAYYALLGTPPFPGATTELWVDIGWWATTDGAFGGAWSAAWNREVWEAVAAAVPAEVR